MPNCSHIFFGTTKVSSKSVPCNVDEFHEDGRAMRVTQRAGVRRARRLAITTIHGIIIILCTYMDGYNTALIAPPLSSVDDRGVGTTQINFGTLLKY